MQETLGQPASRRSSQPTQPPWSVDRVRDLGVVTDLTTAARILGIGRTKAYELVRREAFPVRVIHTGHRIIVPVKPILDLLGWETNSEESV